MNLILIGGAFLGAMFMGPDEPDASKARVEKTSTAAVEQTAHPPARQPAQKTRPLTTTTQNPDSERDRGWMTREITIDRKTGETTEISVIGFAD